MYILWLYKSAQWPECAGGDTYTWIQLKRDVASHMCVVLNNAHWLARDGDIRDGSELLRLWLHEWPWKPKGPWVFADFQSSPGKKAAMNHCRKEEGLDADQAYKNLWGPFHSRCGIYTWGSMKYVHVLGSLCASSAITYVSSFLLVLYRKTSG